MWLSLFMLTKQEAIFLPWNTEPSGTQRSSQEKTTAGVVGTREGAPAQTSCGEGNLLFNLRTQMSVSISQLKMILREKPSPRKCPGPTKAHQLLF